MDKTTPNLFPILRYEDAAAGMRWLRDALGFETAFEVPGEDGKMAFALMSYGGDVLGTGSTRPGLREAVGVYVPDIDGHYERARAAGAKITEELKDTDDGRRGYGVEDPEGHIWGVGDFSPAEKTKSIIFPALGYADASAAMRWLTDVVGFERREVHEENGLIAHAEMSLGTSGIMLGSKKQASDPANPWASAHRGLFVYVEDVDRHYDRAAAAGAEIIRPLNDTSYGAREYSLRDPEGNLWSFGTYLPEWMKPVS